MRPRFTLRTLLIAIVAICLPLGWFSLQLADARRQARAVERLTELGGTVYYDFHHYLDAGGEACLDGAREPQDWSWARGLLGDDYFNRVYYVRFVGQRHIPQQPGFIHFLGPVDTPNELSRHAEEHLGLLQELPDLHSLDLSASEITDEAIPALSKLRSLKWLNVQKTALSREGIDRLRELLPGCDVH